jgi:hypothetical protein
MDSSTKDLISQITPLYNTFKSKQWSEDPASGVEISWEIGNILSDHIRRSGIAPHKLYRTIYGKSEGSSDIAQKSYITREFLGRCYRIRNIFGMKSDIRDVFPTLRSFTVFRESMPFFDNDGAKLSKEEHLELLKLMNSRKPASSIIMLIQEKLKVKLDKYNPRTQRLQDVESHKKVFIDFFNHVYRLNQAGSQSFIELRDHLDPILVETLANVTISISQDGLKKPIIPKAPSSLPSVWADYSDAMDDLISKRTAVDLRRFRRLIPPHQIVRLADMLHELAKKR